MKEKRQSETELSSLSAHLSNAVFACRSRTELSLSRRISSPLCVCVCVKHNGRVQQGHDFHFVLESLASIQLVAGGGRGVVGDVAGERCR
jgi:hypothetical protein